MTGLFSTLNATLFFIFMVVILTIVTGSMIGFFIAVVMIAYKITIGFIGIG